jgi:hypothetical protein
LSAGTNISTISRLQWVGSTDAELANMKVWLYLKQKGPTICFGTQLGNWHVWRMIWGSDPLHLWAPSGDCLLRNLELFTSSHKEPL